MRSLNTDRMPLTPWRDSIHNHVSSALTRMPNPLARVTWQSDAFIAEAGAAGYLEKRADGFFLSRRAVHLWFVTNPRPTVDPDADRRRDLVPYQEVLREMGKEIADREARPPIDKGRLAAQRLASMFEGLGYRPDVQA